MNKISEPVTVWFDTGDISMQMKIHAANEYADSKGRSMEINDRPEFKKVEYQDGSHGLRIVVSEIQDIGTGERFGFTPPKSIVRPAM